MRGNTETPGPTIHRRLQEGDIVAAKGHPSIMGRIVAIDHVKRTVSFAYGQVTVTTQLSGIVVAT
jgi:hypothetical protein